MDVSMLGTVVTLCAGQKILCKNNLIQLSTSLPGNPFPMNNFLSVIISESKFANVDDREYDLWIKALIAFILCINGIKLKKEVPSPVKVGFLYIDDFLKLFSLYISMFKKLSLLSFSISAVNSMFACILLM